MSALSDGMDSPISIRQETILDKVRDSEVVLGLDHKGNVILIKSRFEPERQSQLLSIQVTIDYFSHFIAHQCMKQISGNGARLDMFKEGIAKEVDTVIKKYMESNNVGREIT